ncbi:hypothetical protein ACFOHS_13205 [Jhaorihella thermophila]
MLNSPDNDGGYENFAVNFRHRLDLSGGLALRLGAGFLRGTIYDSTIAHHPPNSGVNRIWNGAWDVNATLSAARFDVMGEFTRTEHAWPATGHKVSALTVQGRYRTELFSRPALWSLAASRGVQGASGTEWEKNGSGGAGAAGSGGTERVAGGPNMSSTKVSCRSSCRRSSPIRACGRIPSSSGPG